MSLYRTIKQDAGSWNCTACVAAMITGCDVEQVHEWTGTNVGDPIWDDELFIWLLKHGWQIDCGVEFREPLQELSLHQPVAFEFKLAGHPCYVSVSSENYPGETHAVFWDGQVLRDPNPKKPDEQPSLEGYVIHTIYPLSRPGQSHVRDCEVRELDSGFNRRKADYRGRPGAWELGSENTELSPPAAETATSSSSKEPLSSSKEVREVLERLRAEVDSTTYHNKSTLHILSIINRYLEECNG